MTENNNKIVIYYDGQCPFCSKYVQLQRLRAAVGNVSLVDLRVDKTAATRLCQKGFDVDEGMIVEHAGSLFHGAGAVHALALMSTGIGPVNWVMSWAFSNRRVSNILYPLLRLGRNLTLRILGRRGIHGHK